MNFKGKLSEQWWQLKRKMHVSNMSFRLLTIIILLLTFGKLVEENILFPKFNKRHAQKVQNIFTQKEEQLLEYMDEGTLCTDHPSRDVSCLIPLHEKNVREMKENGLYIFIYENDSLVYWSTKDIPINPVFSRSGLNQRYVNLDNGRYASFVRHYNHYDVVGLMLIKNVYTYENKYLETSFQEDFKLPPNVKIFHLQIDGSYPIVNTSGQFVLSLIFDSTCYYQYQVYLPALSYFLALLFFFLLLSYPLKKLRNATNRNIYLPFLIIVLLLVRLAMKYGSLPAVFYQLDIFEPHHFGSQWFSSLGDLLLWSIFNFYFFYEVYRYLRFPIFYEHRWKYFTYCFISIFIVIAYFFGTGGLIQSMVINSSDIFEGPNRAILLNGYSFLGYIIIMLYLAPFCMMLDKTIMLFKQELTLQQFLVIYLFALIMVIVGWSMANFPINSFSILTVSVLSYVLGVIRLKKSNKFKYSHYTLLVFILAVYTAILINQYSTIKYKEEKKVIVTNLATQHDLQAEFQLKDIWQRIVTDTTLTELAYNNVPDSNFNVLDYVKRNYFYSSYWNKYYIQCIVCKDNSTLLAEQQLQPNCVNYFKNVIETKGAQLPRMEFWYIDWFNTGSISYLGWFRKTKEEETSPMHLFIDLRMRISFDEELGYPELLLDNRIYTGNILKGYSYAKYYQNRRVSQFGDYKYNLTADIFQTNKKDYHVVYVDGMEHLVYRPDKKNIIVLSTYSPKPIDLIINFSYIFIFYFVVVSIILLLYHLPMIKRTFQWNFRNKIQYTMISIILVSFAIVGIGTVYYINGQSLRRYTDNISEKMQAIHRELLDVMIFQETMDENWNEGNDILTPWLIDLSDRFFTDINLFDIDGRLIATSRPEIFDKGLIGRQINPNAFILLKFGQKASIMQHEDIGGLSYLSAYEPFLDNNNRVIAFLNLPYFTQQDALTEEISSVIMAITNFYMIIILLTVIVSVIMSNQITQPLDLLQEKFRNIKLGAKNEVIRYDRRDEIGGLVKAYNRAIEELAWSANRLARSERESAWREMAKQIAHEINNPLTPMKLSIQHLKRAWDNQSERFDEYMQKISQSLVDQIDTLSAIATEFSNFAKMPSPHNQQIDIIAKLNSVIPLFATGDNKRSFHANFHGIEQATVYADKEQISRVFINLFKNALQAIPKDRQPSIDIDVIRRKNKIWIRVRDNGMGIPEEMQEKIFRPNFTTKSSGMGVGLAIVRNIIEGAGGTITFKTVIGKGTAFIICLPTYD